jgi:hypothetical protein
MLGVDGGAPASDPMRRKAGPLTSHPRARRVGVASIAAAVVAAATFLVGAAPAADAASSNALSITAGEYAYKLSGKPHPGWVQFDFKNGGVEDHMVVVFPLKSGVTTKQLQSTVQNASDLESALGKYLSSDPVTGTPGVLGPNQQTTTIAQMKSGRYGIFCFVTAPDGELHVAHGMIATFDVKGSKSSYKPPSDGVADVTLSDTTITTPPGNAPKNVTLKITNEGNAPHGFQVIKLEAGKTIDDAYTYFNSLLDSGTASGTAPGTLVGGVQSLAPGQIGYLEWTLPAGHYAYVSTDGDAPNDDYSKGLKGEFDIT